MTSILSQTRQDIVELEKKMRDVVSRLTTSEAVAQIALEKVKELERKLEK